MINYLNECFDSKYTGFFEYKPLWNFIPDFFTDQLKLFADNNIKGFKSFFNNKKLFPKLYGFNNIQKYIDSSPHYDVDDDYITFTFNNELISFTSQPEIIKLAVSVYEFYYWFHKNRDKYKGYIEQHHLISDENIKEVFDFYTKVLKRKFKVCYSKYYVQENNINIDNLIYFCGNYYDIDDWYSFYHKDFEYLEQFYSSKYYRNKIEGGTDTLWG
jgi:hypothetical protein